MAGSHTYHNLCYNPPSGGKDELVRGPPGAFTKDRNNFTPSPTVSHTQTSDPALPLSPARSSIEELYQ